MQRKSPYQKDDCLFCERKSMLEAALAQGNASANIRCCDSPECQDKAKKLAQDSFKAFQPFQPKSN